MEILNVTYKSTEESKKSIARIESKLAEYWSNKNRLKLKMYKTRKAFEYFH